jgi:hypothetical protein
MTSPLLEWRPIDTCPMDGTRVLLSEGTLVYVARWVGNRRFGRWGFETAGVNSVFYEPSYWHPLPQPPKAEEAPNAP